MLTSQFCTSIKLLYLYHHFIQSEVPSFIKEVTQFDTTGGQKYFLLIHVSRYHLKSKCHILYSFIEL